jgi:(2R)-3-sulfolactate dehydrogenase (NADP+)
MSCADAFALARAACRARGASPEVATVLAGATVEAHAAGNATVGFGHLVDYLEAMAAGRIDPTAEPALDDPAPAVIRSDARGGIAQLGFARARADLADRASRFGLALFLQSGSYTTGELGWYVRALARQGLAAFAVSNGPALMRPPGAVASVYCTNPMAFAVPGPDGPAMLIDQSCSATAFVALRNAAAQDRPIPAGWAVDGHGRPTTDAKAALRGALLTFGGERGANIALMVEMLAGGFAGGLWSLDAPRFDAGDASPAAGLFVLALSPTVLGPDVAARTARHLARLEGLGVHVPGKRKAESGRRAESEGIDIPAGLVEAMRERAPR